MSRLAALAPWLICLASCVQTLDPCPPGHHLSRSEDRCVTTPPPDTNGVDAGDDGSDAATDSDAIDSLDARPEDGDLVQDADRDADDADTGDAADDAGAVPDAGTNCSAQDVERWADGHKRAGLVVLLTQCSASCSTGDACSPEQCVREAVGIEHCEACTMAESGCTMDHCLAACTGREQDRACVACLCEAGCVTAFERCAETDMHLCSPALFGRDAAPEEYTLSAPILLRQKSQTGGLRATHIDPEAEDWPVESESQFSAGYTQMVAFPLHGREYLLQHKSECGMEPCLARISPVLRDGTFAHPVYMDAWSRGFDEIEVFGAHGELFLLRYKSGRIPSDGEPPGTVLVDRLIADPEHEALALQPAYSSTWQTTAEFDGFTSIEPFVLDGVTYLLLADWSGEIRILRAVPGTSGLAFEVDSEPLRWSAGWDLVETLKVGDRWYVFSYTSGRARSGTGQAGQARVAAFASDEQGHVVIAPPVYDATWSAGLTHALALATPDGAQLATHDAASGTTELRVLAADVESWAATLGTATRKQVWGFRLPWDLVEVVGQGKW